MKEDRFGRVVVHWPRFGPYHIARLESSFDVLQAKGFRVIGLETASHDTTYDWRLERRRTLFERQVAFPGRVHATLSASEMWHRFSRLLGNWAPAAVAITGYTSLDARCLLLWCLLNRCPAILMSESKAGDAPRVWWREWAKSMLVGLYSASICGGSLHRAYLEDLGMSRDRIFLGYDVVDNAYFWRQSEKVRKHPAQFQHLPGLSEDTPFFLASARFIARKNLAGLLQAYDRYRDCMARIEGNRLWRLIILGDGEERERLEQMIVSRGLEEVTLAGFRQIEELPAYYALASAFIHPAYQEQWGLVVNEAMAAGLPVLVSKRCGCAPELVVDGENGFTFDPRRIDALAALMVKMSCGRVNLDAMGRASRVRIAEWGPNRFAEGLYRAVRVSL